MDINQAVVSTKYVVEEKSKVVYVCHDEDGWQFYGDEREIYDSDARVVSLGSIIKNNHHVEQILWIPEGMEAWMNNETEGWQTGVSTFEE